MTPQCEVCGETRLDGWTVCPACGYPYPTSREHDEDDDELHERDLR